MAAALDAAGVRGERADIVIDPPIAYGSPPTTGYSDDPVNTGTGGFLENEEDLGFAGAGWSLAWTRSYQSLNAAEGAFGRGWSSWAEAGLTFDDTAARLRLSDGRVVVFPRAGAGWERATGESLWLERAEEAGRADVVEGGYVVTSSWGLEWLIDAAGRVVGTSAGEGSGVTLVWEGGRLVRMAHERGRFVDLEWDGARITAAQASDGRRVVYSYDEAGRLVGADRPVGARAYRWDGAGLLAEVVDADGVVEVSNTFDATGRVTGQRSPLGRVTRYAYLAGSVTVTSDEDG